MGISPIRTKRLLIREFRTSDWRAVHAYTSDPETVRYTEGPDTGQDAKRFVRHAISHQSSRPRTQYDFAVTLGTTGDLIGHCGMEKRPKRKEGEIGYILSRAYWSKGYGTEVAMALLEFGFRRLALHRITALCDPQNIGSKRVSEKAGMRLEGHLKEDFPLRGKWHDTMVYAILESEWDRHLKVDP